MTVKTQNILDNIATNKPADHFDTWLKNFKLSLSSFRKPIQLNNKSNLYEKIEEIANFLCANHDLTLEEEKELAKERLLSYRNPSWFLNEIPEATKVDFSAVPKEVVDAITKKLPKNASDDWHNYIFAFDNVEEGYDFKDAPKTLFDRVFVIFSPSNSFPHTVLRDAKDNGQYQFMLGNLNASYGYKLLTNNLCKKLLPNGLNNYVRPNAYSNRLSDLLDYTSNAREFGKDYELLSNLVIDKLEQRNKAMKDLKLEDCLAKRSYSDNFYHYTLVKLPKGSKYYDEYSDQSKKNKFVNADDTEYFWYPEDDCRRIVEITLPEDKCRMFTPESTFSKAYNNFLFSQALNEWIKDFQAMATELSLKVSFDPSTPNKQDSTNQTETENNMQLCLF